MIEQSASVLDMRDGQPYTVLYISALDTGLSEE